MKSSSETPPLLEAKGVVCGYGTRAILKNVDFSVSGGQHWAVVGDNGEGKSTLLRTLVGLLPSLGGHLSLYPRPEEISLVPQHPTRDLRMPMTVEDFVELGFPPGFRPNKSSRQEMIHTALNRLGLSQRKEDISILSGGQFQRVVLARSLVHHPCLLFLDEPARGLDQKSNSLFMEELKCCPKHDAPAIVMVLHDLRLLKHYFSHLLWIHDGTALAIEMKDLQQHSELMEYLGNSQ